LRQMIRPRSIFRLPGRVWLSSAQKRPMFNAQRPTLNRNVILSGAKDLSLGR